MQIMTTVMILHLARAIPCEAQLVADQSGAFLVIASNPIGHYLAGRNGLRPDKRGYRLLQKSKGRKGRA